MLFFGLDLMHQNVAPMADEAWFADLLAWTDGSYLFGFVIGCVLSFIVQSSVAVTAVVLAFQGAGVFGAGETLMIVYGANVGSSMPTRSEERRVGKEGGSTCRSRWSPSH